MHTNVAYTPEHDAAIRDCYRTGGEVAQVAERLGLTRNQVIGRARRIGAKHVNPGMPHAPKKCGRGGARNPKRDRAICELLMRGWSVRDVAAVYDLTWHRVHQIRMRHLKRTVTWEWRDA